MAIHSRHHVAVIDPHPLEVEAIVANPFIGLTGFAMLLAAAAWWRVYQSLRDRKSDQVSQVVWSRLGSAALFTAATFGLALIAWIWRAVV